MNFVTLLIQRDHPPLTCAILDMFGVDVLREATPDAEREIVESRIASARAFQSLQSGSIQAA